MVSDSLVYRYLLQYRLFSAAKSPQQLHMLDLSDFMRYGTTEIGLRPPDYLLPLYQNNSYAYSPS